MKKKDRISVEGNQVPLDNSPFDKLDFSAIDLTEGKAPINERTSKTIGPRKKELINIYLEKGGRGGKLVTVLKGILGANDRRDLLKVLQKQCGCGGTVKGELIEIQGDKREETAKILGEQGYRVIV